jgi:putative hemolysin
MFHVTKTYFLLFILALILSACKPGQPNPTQPTPIPPTESQPTPDPADLPNPASVFCEEQGGQIEIRTDASGNQVGVCLFQDGSECDEWAYFRDECQPGQPQSTAVPGLTPSYVNDTYGFSFDHRGIGR